MPKRNNTTQLTKMISEEEGRNKIEEQNFANSLSDFQLSITRKKTAPIIIVDETRQITNKFATDKSNVNIPITFHDQTLEVSKQLAILGMYRSINNNNSAPINNNNSAPINNNNSASINNNNSAPTDTNIQASNELYKCSLNYILNP